MRTPLSAIDAFFVAYQARAGISMALVAEQPLSEPISRGDLERGLRYALTRWPQLGQRIRPGLRGLYWAGESSLDGMIVQAGPEADLAAWRAGSCDPFQDPPLQALLAEDGRLLILRLHHAAMDGQGFLHVCASVARGIDDAPRKAAEPPPPPLPVPRGPSDLYTMWRYRRWMEDQRREDTAARIATRSLEPGPVASLRLALGPDGLARLQARAADREISPPWLAAAAWLRAIHRWNRSHDRAPTAEMSLEVPVSLRENRRCPLGNHLALLLITGDADAPLEALARSLRSRFRDGVAERHHLAVPTFSALGRQLPWAIFERVAVTPKTTGFATSHFVWLRRPPGLGRARYAGGQSILTPVCLRMGAALTALASDEGVQLFISYRQTALTDDDASSLGGMLIEELTG